MARTHPCSPRYKAGTDPGQDAILSQVAYTHSQSDRDNLDMPVHLLTCTSLWIWKETIEYLGKTHKEMWKTCQLYTNSDPGQELIFFFHQCYNKMTFNKHIFQISVVYGRVEGTEADQKWMDELPNGNFAIHSISVQFFS